MIKFELYKKQNQKYVKILETMAYIGQNGIALEKKKMPGESEELRKKSVKM